MNLCVVAYPELSAADYARIQEYRCQNDAYFRVVEPHFTLAFPTSDWEAGPYIAEVRKQVAGTRPFGFCIRGAALNKDMSGELYHAFLVPDEGHSQFLKLRHSLIADRFFCPEVYEYDFIPHIGVGNSRDPGRCAAMVADWNSQPFEIQGSVKALDVAKYEDDKVTRIERVLLGA